MFGNEFIDYCVLRYEELVNVANKVDKSYFVFLQEYGRAFAIFHAYIHANPNTDIPVTALLEQGLDFQQICLLIFLFYTKGLNIRMSPDFTSVVFLLR